LEAVVFRSSIILVLVVLGGFLETVPPKNLSNYRRIEAYEVRPEMLVMPRYSENGVLCELDVEKSHFSDSAIDLDPTAGREQFIQVINELAPEWTRGQLTSDLYDQYLSLYNGSSVTTFKDYSDLSIKIYGRASRDGHVSEVAATVAWKKPECTRWLSTKSR
jgi:hypothetical protein